MVLGAIRMLTLTRQIILLVFFFSIYVLPTLAFGPPPPPATLAFDGTCIDSDGSCPGAGEPIILTTGSVYFCSSSSSTACRAENVVADFVAGSITLTQSSTRTFHLVKEAAWALLNRAGGPPSSTTISNVIMGDFNGSARAGGATCRSQPSFVIQPMSCDSGSSTCSGGLSGSDAQIFGMSCSSTIVRSK